MYLCFNSKYTIEVDGGQHSIEREKDLKRDGWLETQGYKVLRFWNNHVLTNINGVLEVIRENLNHPPLKGVEKMRGSPFKEHKRNGFSERGKEEGRLPQERSK